MSSRLHPNYGQFKVQALYFITSLWVQGQEPGNELAGELSGTLMSSVKLTFKTGVTFSLTHGVVDFISHHIVFSIGMLII